MKMKICDCVKSAMNMGGQWISDSAIYTYELNSRHRCSDIYIYIERDAFKDTLIRMLANSRPVLKKASGVTFRGHPPQLI